MTGYQPRAALDARGFANPIREVRSELSRNQRVPTFVGVDRVPRPAKEHIIRCHRWLLLGSLAISFTLGPLAPQASFRHAVHRRLVPSRPPVGAGAPSGRWYGEKSAELIDTTRTVAT